jgi:hypothetical protein
MMIACTHLPAVSSFSPAAPPAATPAAEIMMRPTITSMYAQKMMSESTRIATKRLPMPAMRKASSTCSGVSMLS